jgi:hypothetical protein
VPPWAVGYAGDTAIVRIAALDGNANPLPGVLITSDSISGIGRVAPRSRRTNSDGKADFSVIFDTAVENPFSESHLLFAAQNVSRFITLRVVSLAPTHITILMDSLEVTAGISGWKSAPVAASDEYGNSVELGRVAWASRDSAIAGANAAGGETAVFFGLQPGRTWVVAHSCPPKVFFCSDSHTLQAEDSILVLVR